MCFKGIKIRFDCKDSEQYRNIGDFWNYMRTEYPNHSLKGVGCNWNDDSFDYIIGDFATLDFCMDKIKKRYLTADYYEITLPDSGWQIYHGKTENLSELYNEIYKNGVLDYEVEEFFSNGDCKISIYRL
ncbi:MAG: hypothetical protein FWB80_01760 [Defluviitaleaceae bacterium]|nr:hypothetical protein [Defluviitaleaceae bacterium]